ncbi:uncharacterized protein [Nicotiana sylvestris]|uniref:uncharacterized protein n=1 Tax=Nicotiana sylvestris TaxID=4096 RepID=UPI00388C8FA6
MATPATAQPSMEVGQSSSPPITSPQPSTIPNPIQNYANLLKPNALNAPMQTVPNVAIKHIEYLHGEPIVRWKKQELRQSIAQQGLNLAVLGKFSYGKPGIHDLRKALPTQCELKGPCSVGLIEHNHVLIKLSLMEDYIHLLSKPAYYLKIYNEMWQMRCTKWNPWWKVNEETPIAIAWISFQDLPPNFFGKEFVFSLARAVRRPLHVDLATQNCTRPSCAKVKVEVNLLANLSQRIKIVEEEDETGPEEFKWIKIRYDYMPKYCKYCKNKDTRKRNAG